MVAAQADGDLKVVDIADHTLVRTMIHPACDRVRQGWMGRQVPKLESFAGLIDLMVTGHLFTRDSASFQMVIGGLLQEAQAAVQVWDQLAQADREQGVESPKVVPLFSVKSHKVVPAKW